MRRPVLTRFAVVSFVGLSALVVACAKSEDPDLFGPGTDIAKTEPEEAGTTKKLPPKTQKITPPAPVPVEAGVVDAAPPEEEPEPEPEPEECPQDMTHQIAALTASLSGTATPCPGGGSDCSQGECCYVNSISPMASLCIAE